MLRRNSIGFAIGAFVFSILFFLLYGGRKGRGSDGTGGW